MARLYGELNTNISPNIDCPRDKITGSYLSDDDGFLYGELNQKAEKITYIGKSNDTIDLIVDNRNRTIEAVSKLSTGDIEKHIKNVTIHVTSEDKTNWNNKYTKPLDGIPYSDLSESVQLSLDKAESSIQEETDPTVPSWAKQPNKPTYTKLEVGLGNVDDIKQYSASNPPPYPVNSVNGQTGDVVLHIPTIPDGVMLFSDINKNSPTPLTSVSLRYIRDVDNDIEYVVPQGTYSKPTDGIPKTDLAIGVQTSLGKADTALQSVPNTYRTASAQDAIDDAQDTAINAKYTKPSTGIPASDLASGVLPSFSTDPDQNVYEINGKYIAARYDSNVDEIVSKYATKAEMNAKYTKPSGGIPASDLASGVIPETSVSIGAASTNNQIPTAKAVYDLFSSIPNLDEVSY